MDILTIDDLKAAGFVHYSYKDYTRLNSGLISEDLDKIVHSSVPVGETKAATESKDFNHPVIKHELGYGYEAKWGAVRFPLRNEKELHDFMRLFEYQITQ